MSTNNPDGKSEDAKARRSENELDRLVASIADALKKGTEGHEKSWQDKMWERMPALSTFVGGVVLSIVALIFNYNYNKQQQQERQDQATLQATEKLAQAAFEQSKFVADESDRKRRVIVEVVPRLFGSAAEREAAQAVLSECYPNDAPEILRRLVKDNGAPEKSIAPEIEKAQARATEVGAWGIVVGHDDSAESAQAEVAKVEKQGFTGVIYKKRNFFITVAQGRIGQSQSGFANQVDAQSANYIVRAQVRDGTYVVNLKSWCGEMQDKGGYLQCANN